MGLKLLKKWENNLKEDKRKDYISWDGYFMGLAALASFRSKDPSTRNGACIVNPITKSPLALGYNGFVRGCSDSKYPWARTADKESNTKYPYVEHAERNAIYNAVKNGVKLDDSVLYLYSEKGYYPCSDCARAIIQSGIQEVIIGFCIEENTDKYDWTPTKRMFKSANITIRVLNKKALNKDLAIIIDNFGSFNKILA